MQNEMVRKIKGNNRNESQCVSVLPCLAKILEEENKKKKSKLFQKYYSIQEESSNSKKQSECPRHYILPRFLELWPCEIDFFVNWIQLAVSFPTRSVPQFLFLSLKSKITSWIYYTL